MQSIEHRSFGTPDEPVRVIDWYGAGDYAKRHWPEQGGRPFRGRPDVDYYRRRLTMSRKIADCRRFESDSRCSLTIIGEEGELVEAAAAHAVAVHGHEDTAELRVQIGELLEPEDSYVSGERAAVPFPG